MIVYVNKANGKTRRLVNEFRTHYVYVAGSGGSAKFSSFTVNIMRCDIDPELVALLKLQGHRVVFHSSVRDIVEQYTRLRPTSKITTIAKWKCRL